MGFNHPILRAMKDIQVFIVLFFIPLINYFDIKNRGPTVKYMYVYETGTVLLLFDLNI